MVKIVKELPSKEIIKSLVLDTISNSKSPIILTKKYNISKSLLSYYLKTLKDKGIIRKLEKGHWEIVKGYLELTSTRKARGHAFIWKIKFHKKYDGWDKRQEILDKLKIPYQLTGNTIRIKINNKKVWLNNKSIIIYENKSFFDSSPLETRKMAIYEMINDIKTLENTLKIDLGKYNFTTKREHIAWVKDNLAIQCNKEGQKLKILDKGELWMEVDNSHNEDETEFYKTLNNSAMTNSTGYNNYYNSLKKNNWLATDFTLNGFNILTKNQLEQAKQINEFAIALNRHIPAYEGMANFTKQLVDEFRELKEEIKKINK